MIRPKKCPFCGAAGVQSYCIDKLNNRFACRICGEQYYSDGTYAEDTYDRNWNGYSDPDDFPTDGYDIGDGY